ncbi:hypothetical protein SEA_STUFF_40 [Streptomyces phage Stuff]|nr:hypothetical protein SEA_INTOLERANT_39 [Streptomyces phage Intolerant]UTN91871.1 hypothetical protein SEA_STUFF_40 [Streptomyces phage Stuff]
MVDRMTIHLPGPFSVSTRGAWRAARANDRKQLAEFRQTLRDLHAWFTRPRESKKIKNLRRERAREIDRLARQHRRDGTIT